MLKIYWICLLYLILCSGTGYCSTDTITVEFKNIPIVTAFETIFNKMGVSYTIHQNISGYINASIVDMPYNEAIQTIAKNIGVTATKDGNGMYTIKPKIYTQQNIVVTEPAIESKTTTPTTEEIKLEVIHLQNMSPYQMLMYLGYNNNNSGYSNNNSGYNNNNSGYNNNNSGYNNKRY